MKNIYSEPDMPVQPPEGYKWMFLENGGPDYVFPSSGIILALVDKDVDRISTAATAGKYGETTVRQHTGHYESSIAPIAEVVLISDIRNESKQLLAKYLSKKERRTYLDKLKIQLEEADQ